LLGFPPSDDAARGFLFKYGVGDEQRFVRHCAFLKGLFDHTNDVLGDLDSFINNAGMESVLEGSPAEKFRALMNWNMSSERYGTFRCDFYDKVVATARSVRAIPFLECLP
jgi:NAD(P)-dependent dehydrogenase (short-subunit alcohol dehydrogenase family)